METRELPLLTEAATTGEGVDDERRFTFALDALLSGFAAALRQ